MSNQMTETQDTGKFRKNTKDQYYTKSTVAKKCVDKILELYPQAYDYVWVEPSAGSGVFLKTLPASTVKVGVDVDPKSTGIEKGDFLTWSPNKTDKQQIVFGNPPFGKQGSLAKAFIKHASEFATIIAFILPRSFVKPSMSRAFPMKFHCVWSEEIEKDGFEVNGKAYDVPCVFQIWEKKIQDRTIPTPVGEEGFMYVKHEQPFHIACKRVGGMAGKCAPWTPTAAADYNPQYHYYIRLDADYVAHVSKIIELMNGHVFPSNTLGPRSLSKSEINEVLNEFVAAAVAL
jgi:hypothetical protein